MRAILIDPVAKTVSEIDEPILDLKALHRLTECDTVTLVRIADTGDLLFVDDNGLVSIEPKAMFAVDGYDQPLAGKGLITGDEDDDGKLTATKLDIEKVRAVVSFPDIEFDHMEHEEGVIDHPDLGPGTFTHRMIPVFRRK